MEQKKILFGYCELYKKIEYINNNENKKIVIDSALGSFKNIGKVLVKEKKFIAGNGVNEGLEIKADIILQGIVGKNYNNIEKNKIELDCVNLNTINKVIEKILKILPELV